MGVVKRKRKRTGKVGSLETEKPTAKCSKNLKKDLKLTDFEISLTFTPKDKSQDTFKKLLHTFFRTEWMFVDNHIIINIEKLDEMSTVPLIEIIHPTSENKLDTELKSEYDFVHQKAFFSAGPEELHTRKRKSSCASGKNKHCTDPSQVTCEACLSMQKTNTVLEPCYRYSGPAVVLDNHHELPPEFLNDRLVTMTGIGDEATLNHKSNEKKKTDSAPTIIPAITVSFLEKSN